MYDLKHPPHPRFGNKNFWRQLSIKVAYSEMIVPANILVKIESAKCATVSRRKKSNLFNTLTRLVYRLVGQNFY
jgi:hypothetical protein